jgi:Arc/MetJ-type ribon-helix-helix transcriptional regulator
MRSINADSAKTRTLSVRVPEFLAAEVAELSVFLGIDPSEFMRRSIEEMNERVMAERILAASRALRARTTELAPVLDGTVSDGFAGT